ncbi:hypothetical protein [Paraliobacillus sp. X-1268]|uniref:hypothetical protein n=1 Tax=Paraliobacillus sp. X-1268 TaxID=2213193 RepID=UPI000E3CDBD9|nr:hypothetical protein [Paraliobacillus sp. X-1268]
MFNIFNAKLIIVTILVFFSFSAIVEAATTYIDYFGTMNESRYLWANTATGNDEFLAVQYVSNSNDAVIQYYENINGSASLMSTAKLQNGSGTVTPPAGTNAIKLVSNDGGVVYLTYVQTTNPNGTDVYFNAPEGGGGGSSGETIVNVYPDVNVTVSSPHFTEYMAKLTEIKNAIPPVPNWGNVADIFRDSIAPQIKADMTALLGRAPDAPDAPSAPSAPSMPGALDNGGLQAPTGKEAPGLADSGFTEDDIKNEAEEIEVREDPTGGFDLPDDPTIGLPSQEEFLENAPEEGAAPLPGAPVEQENIPPDPGDTTETAPEPPEDTVELPGAPEDGATFPEAPQDGATVPTAPEESENFSPTPSGDTSTAPVPSDDTGTAPTPGESFDGYPIPGADTSTAPIPKGG